jgi:chemotaxis protein MotB
VSGGGGHGKRRGHYEEHEEHENHERWLVSYADMMTLLMVLFIVMFAISQVDQRKFMALKTGLAAGFGAPVAFVDGADRLLDPGGSVAPDTVNLAGSAGDGKASAAEKENQQKQEQAQAAAVAKLVDATNRAQVEQEVNNLRKARAQIAAALARQGLNNAATFRFDERGLVVTIATDKVLFDSGSADLTPEGKRILDAIAPTLAEMPNRLSVDGHTNWLPISTPQFPSNWELSGDRAAGVLRYLIAQHGIPGTRMTATGFADTRPLLPRSDPRALTADRRVEIVVLARVDDSAGRTVASMGNETPSGTAAGAGSVGGGSTGGGSGSAVSPGAVTGAGGIPAVPEGGVTDHATSSSGEG